MQATRRAAAARDRAQPGAHSAAVAAAQAIIVRARRCVPELIQLFENGLAKRRRIVFRRPLPPPASPTDFGGFDEDEPLEFIVGPFDEVFEEQACRAIRLGEQEKSVSVSTKSATGERIDVVYVGECGEWICVFYE